MADEKAAPASAPAGDAAAGLPSEAVPSVEALPHGEQVCPEVSARHEACLQKWQAPVCPYCGKRQGFIFGLTGFGLRLRGHAERCKSRCAAPQEQVARSDQISSEPPLSRPSPSEACVEKALNTPTFQAPHDQEAAPEAAAATEAEAIVSDPVVEASNDPLEGTACQIDAPAEVKEVEAVATDPVAEEASPDQEEAPEATVETKVEAVEEASHGQEESLEATAHTEVEAVVSDAVAEASHGQEETLEATAETEVEVSDAVVEAGAGKVNETLDVLGGDVLEVNSTAAGAMAEAAPHDQEEAQEAAAATEAEAVVSDPVVEASNDQPEEAACQMDAPAEVKEVEAVARDPVAEAKEEAATEQPEPTAQGEASQDQAEEALSPTVEAEEAAVETEEPEALPEPKASKSQEEVASPSSRPPKSSAKKRTRR
ncbi:1a [Symbiodinium sp. CCMP2592]|nr:1a [Symbiodinium sp. CCMP2592]